MDWIALTKKWLLIPSVSFLILLLAGCWDRVEINDLAIVVGIGLHKTDDDLIELSMQMVNPSSMISGQGGSGGQQGNGQLTTVEKAVGKNIL